MAARLSLPALIKFLKKHYEELSALWNELQNYDHLEAIVKMQQRIQILIENLERLEGGCLIDDDY